MNAAQSAPPPAELRVSLAELAALCAPFAPKEIRAPKTRPVRLKRTAVIRVLAHRGFTAQEIGEALDTDLWSVKRTAQLYGIEVRDERRYDPKDSLKARAEREIEPASGRPERTARRLHLVEDTRPDRWAGRNQRIRVGLGGDVLQIQLGRERRRSDCARLILCEEAWIEAHGGDQAQCPKTCAAFAPRGLSERSRA
jgi:hypothetical protein